MGSNESVPSSPSYATFEQDTEVNQEQRTSVPQAKFLSAVDRGDVEAVKQFLSDPGVDPKAQNHVAICLAASQGHLSVVELLLQHGLDAASNSSAALRRAAANGHSKIVERLLQLPGMDPTAFNHEAMRRAAFHGHVHIIQLLLQVPGREVNDAFLAACLRGQVGVVTCLLEAGAVASILGNAALRHAITAANLPLVQLLLAQPDVLPGLTQEYDLILLALRLAVTSDSQAAQHIAQACLSAPGVSRSQVVLYVACSPLPVVQSEEVRLAILQLLLQQPYTDLEPLLEFMGPDPQDEQQLEQWKHRKMEPSTLQLYRLLWGYAMRERQRMAVGVARSGADMPTFAIEMVATYLWMPAIATQWSLDVQHLHRYLDQLKKVRRTI